MAGQTTAARWCRRLAAWGLLAAALLGRPEAAASQRVRAPLEVEVSHEVAGRRGGRLLVRITLLLAAQGLGRARIAEVEVAQLEVRGEVLRGQVPMDTFAYAFTVPLEGAQVPVVLERELRPGEYRLRLEVHDTVSGRRGEREVPLGVAVPPSLPPVEARAPAAEAEGRRRLALIPPPGEALTGVQRFTALVEGEVARVDFLLDGALAATRHRPPYQVNLDLGALPRTTTVTAVARDGAGVEVDRAEVVVNQGRERFVVRLQPITPADRREGQVRLRAWVQVPSERQLRWVRLYRDEQLVGEFSRSPVEVWVPEGDGRGLVRVLACLDDDTLGEDVTFLHHPSFLTGVRVDAVELPVTVLGEGGRPVEDLGLDDFQVLEDGVPQRLTHAARQGEVPVRVGLVIDTSGSMERTLPEVQRVALGFLRQLLRPTDRAFVVAFADRPALVEPFSRDFEALGRALLTLRAEGLTALYDAVVFSLFQFSGVRGRRALVVLTDGEDNASRHTLEEAVAQAARVGATVYTIGVDLSARELRARAGLKRLARATGGEAFFVASGGGLERVYATIDRELRSQYLLVYTSSSDKPPGAFRAVEVRVRRPGLEVRAPAGYLPE